MAQRLNTFISAEHFRRLKVWAASTNQKIGEAVESLIDDVLTKDVLPGGQLTALTEGPPALQFTPPAAQMLKVMPKQEGQPWTDDPVKMKELELSLEKKSAPELSDLYLEQARRDRLANEYFFNRSM